MLKTAFYTHFYIPDTSGYIQAVLSPIYQKKKTGSSPTSQAANFYTIF